MQLFYLLMMHILSSLLVSCYQSALFRGKQWEIFLNKDLEVVMNNWYGSGHQQLLIIEQQWIQVRHDWFIKYCSDTLYCSVLTQPASTTTWVRTTTVTSSGVSWETPSTRCYPTLREHTNQSPTSRCTPQCTSVSASSTVNSCTQISWPMSGTRTQDTMNYCRNLYHQV